MTTLFPAANTVSNPGGRGGALDVLRFVAALFVVIFHFGPEAPTPLADLHGFFGRGYMATDFFLLLSGFVLAKAYGKGVVAGKVTLGRFWLKRFARCYPTHIITLAALVAMVLIATAIGRPPETVGRFPLSGIPDQILLLQAFGRGGEEWNVPSWTISTLLICYAFFPFLWRRFVKIGSPVTALALAVLIILGSDVLTMAAFGEHQYNLSFKWCFFRALPLFLAGLCVARVVQTANLSAVAARTTALFGVGALLINAFLDGPDAITMLSIMVIVIGCGASPATRPIPGAEWAAKMSFCLFMVHTITGAVWYDGVELVQGMLAPDLATHPLPAWLMWAGGVVFTVIVAGLYHQFVDDPIQHWIKRNVFDRWQYPSEKHPAQRQATAPSA